MAVLFPMAPRTSSSVSSERPGTGLSRRQEPIGLGQTEHRTAHIIGLYIGQAVYGMFAAASLLTKGHTVGNTPIDQVTALQPTGRGGASTRRGK